MGVKTNDDFADRHEQGSHGWQTVLLMYRILARSANGAVLGYSSISSWLVKAIKEAHSSCRKSKTNPELSGFFVNERRLIARWSFYLLIYAPQDDIMRLVAVDACTKGGEN